MFRHGGADRGNSALQHALRNCPLCFGETCENFVAVYATGLETFRLRTLRKFRRRSEGPAALLAVGIDACGCVRATTTLVVASGTFAIEVAKLSPRHTVVARPAALLAPIVEEGSDGVRLMTVHKAKGLEFPVVILADMSANLAPSEATRHLDPDTWAVTAPRREGSWWTTYAAWLAAHSGAPVPPPPIGNAAAGYVVLGDAPGTYVLED